MFHNDLVIVAPADTPAVFALDAHTGRRIWINDQLADVLHLLGVVNQNLILSGNRLRALDIRSGQQLFIWPESERAGIRGIGRGLVAGEEIFWPARDAIYAFNALTGQRTRSPFKPAGVHYRGANLAAAHGYLIVATHDTLVALGPTANASPRTTRR
jgi:outer membrane protein assembly factor BamB